MPVAEELGIRSEQESLSSIPDVLAAFKRTNDTDELATLLMITTQLYADAGCRCEEKAAVLGETSEEAVACSRKVAETQQAIFDTYRSLVASLKGR